MVLLARFDLIEHDFDHDMLVSVSIGLDAHVERVKQYASAEDADAWDALHDLDNTLGLGFTAAQTYLTSVSRALGLKRTKAVALGPKRAGDFTIAEIINEAANFWKHRDEWEEEDSDQRLKKLRDKTVKVLAAAGVDVTIEYPLSTLLEKLELTTIRHIADTLLPWRDELWRNRNMR